MAQIDNGLEPSVGRGITPKRVLKVLSRPMLAFRNLKLAVDRTVSDEPHIFVMGPPRSGKALIPRVLRAHPRIAALDSQASRFCLRRHHVELALPEVAPARLRTLVRQARDAVDRFDLVAREVRGTAAVRFVEKTPDHILRIDFLQTHFPKSQSVFVVRDPRDGYLSAKEHPFLKSADLDQFAEHFRRSVRRYIDRADTNRTLTVRYEDFCTDPSGQLGRLMGFLGVAPDAGQLGPARFSRTALLGRKATGG